MHGGGKAQAKLVGEDPLLEGQDELAVSVVFVNGGLGGGSVVEDAVSVPESPPLGLYDTVPVQLYWQLHVKCCALLMFHCSEVVVQYFEVEVHGHVHGHVQVVRPSTKYMCTCVRVHVHSQTLLHHVSHRC